MIVVDCDTFTDALRTARMHMAGAPEVQAARWQGKDVAGKPQGQFIELRNVELCVDLRGIEDLDHWRRDVRPNLPWADEHFAERVGGEPLNPAPSWVRWPWAGSAAKFVENQQFEVSYPEMFWPKYARQTDGGRLPHKFDGRGVLNVDEGYTHEGMNGAFGDLLDWVDTLAADPHTRAAWFPMFHPDEVNPDRGRRMCSLGYQVMVRDGAAHMYYPLRSCDIVRHLPDDIYLAVRLLLWALEKLRAIDSRWDDVRPGEFLLHATSLHAFAHEREKIARESCR